ncbi:hypothetical protein ILUMI_13573 [Ignelater luminosus]|uniref:Uncharacterized protein n=1 Tax=Ignelater luminosus TaxID=2038154 RepID=A0A8K0CYA0_IGNLU|nr:hypothetical protein ILUMI_13573 [Ignelater luminosus]
MDGVLVSNINNGSRKSQCVKKKVRLEKKQGRYEANDLNLQNCFGSPGSDICRYCERLKYKVTTADCSQIKNEASTSLKIHKMRAKQFYLMMEEEDVASAKRFGVTTAECFKRNFTGQRESRRVDMLLKKRFGEEWIKEE